MSNIFFLNVQDTPCISYINKKKLNKIIHTNVYQIRLCNQWLTNSISLQRFLMLYKCNQLKAIPKIFVSFTNLKVSPYKTKAAVLTLHLLNSVFIILVLQFIYCTTVPVTNIKYKRSYHFNNFCGNHNLSFLYDACDIPSINLIPVSYAQMSNYEISKYSKKNTRMTGFFKWQ